jgi:hypothetical protein
MEPMEYFKRTFDRYPFAGLTIYVKDVELTEEAAEKYRPGFDFTDINPTGATRLLGGLAASCRFTILSNQMGEEGKKDRYGAVRFPPFKRYKVLDNYTSHGRRQILLLHVPSEWSFFRSFELQDDARLVRACRAIFEDWLSQEVVPVLREEAWAGDNSYPMFYDFAGPEELPAR